MWYLRNNKVVKQSLIEKFWSYLGFSDKTINERQLLRLICLLGKEPNISIKPASNEIDLLNQIILLYIDKMETNSFYNLTEQEIIQELCLVS